jgi:hypothetical protein
MSSPPRSRKQTQFKANDNRVTDAGAKVKVTLEPVAFTGAFFGSSAFGFAKLFRA